MTAELQLALWGVATVTPLALNIATKRGPDALGLSCMIVLLWTLTCVFGALYTPPESMQWFPIMDALAGFTALAAWKTRKAWWKLALAYLYLGQCIAHLSFWAAWPADGALVVYLWVLNTLYGAQLACVAFPGVRHVLALVVVSAVPTRPWRGGFTRT